MFCLFKDRSFTTFRIPFLFVSFLARKYIQKLEPTTPTRNTIKLIILKISKVFIIYQSIGIMSDLALALVNMITKFIDGGDDTDISKVFDFCTTMMAGFNLALPVINSAIPGINFALFNFTCFKLRHSPRSLVKFLLAAFPPGCLYALHFYKKY